MIIFLSVLGNKHMLAAANQQLLSSLWSLSVFTSTQLLSIQDVKTFRQSLDVLFHIWMKHNWRGGHFHQRVKRGFYFHCRFRLVLHSSLLHKNTEAHTLLQAGVQCLNCTTSLDYMSTVKEQITHRSIIVVLFCLYMKWFNFLFHFPAVISGSCSG